MEMETFLAVARGLSDLQSNQLKKGDWILIGMSIRNGEEVCLGSQTTEKEMRRGRIVMTSYESCRERAS